MNRASDRRHPIPCRNSLQVFPLAISEVCFGQVKSIKRQGADTWEIFNRAFALAHAVITDHVVVTCVWV